MSVEPPADATVHDELEVSKHMQVSPFGVDKYLTEWEVHIGTADEFYVTEATARRVEQNLGLDLEDGDYRAGCEVIVVPAEGNDGE